MQIRVEAESESLDALVPTLILQPLVENALRHGIALRPGPGSITIRACRMSERLQLTVADDGPGLASAQPVGGVGLSNTRARLRRHYGDLHSFHLTGQLQGGVVAAIDIPYRTAVPQS